MRKIERFFNPNFYQESVNRARNKRLFFNYLLDDLYHMLIVGPTGIGKSKLIEALIRHLVNRRDKPTVILLDPGGATAQAVENWALKEKLFDQLTLLDPAEEKFYLTFNPLKRFTGAKLEPQAKHVQEAILVALEIDQLESVFYIPQLEEVIYNLAYLLMETGQGLREASYLLTSAPSAKAIPIIEKTKSEVVKGFWLALQRQNLRDRQQKLGVAQARLLPFLTSELIQRMATYQERGIDFSKFIESGKLFLANLEAGPCLTRQDTKLLANLLISSIVRACFSRPAYTGKEVYLFIEECGEGLIGTEIGLMLRRARKQNLKVILLNQDISSLIERNKEVFYQIWSNTNFKVAFGDLPMEDLKVLAYEFFGEEFNLKKLKDEIFRTYFEPKETTRTVASSNYADSFSIGESRNLHFGSFFGTRHENRTAMSGLGESVVAFYEYLKQKELASRDFYSIEELLHQAMVKLKGLEKGVIALKRRGEPVNVLEVPHIADIKPSVERDILREKIFKNSSFYATIDEVEQEEARRDKEIKSYAD
jgi:DNA polymerase III delta prime subunit